MHMWGAPVADAKRVPSPDRSRRAGNSTDGSAWTSPSPATWSTRRAVRELRAQLADRCIRRYWARSPDTSGAGNDRSPWGRAVKQVHRRIWLRLQFLGQCGHGPRLPETHQRCTEGRRGMGQILSRQGPARDPRRPQMGQPQDHFGRHHGLHRSVDRLHFKRGEELRSRQVLYGRPLRHPENAARRDHLAGLAPRLCGLLRLSPGRAGQLAPAPSSL